MEQKKTLWIVAALGIFLLVVFLGTLIIYSPQAPAQIITSNSDAWINPQTPAPVVPEVVEKAQETTKSDTQENIINTDEVTVINQGTTTVYSQDGVMTFDLTQKNSSTVTETKPVQTVQPVVTQKPSITPVKPTVTQKTETPKPVVTEKKVVTKPVETKKLADEYWVQAASFASKANAENARNALIKEKIPAEVFAFNNKDNVTYYRVRVGPYTTKSEADYWNSFIKTVDNFTDTNSYVTNTSKPAQN